LPDLLAVLVAAGPIGGGGAPPWRGGGRGGAAPPWVGGVLVARREGRGGSGGGAAIKREGTPPPRPPPASPPAGGPSAAAPVGWPRGLPAPLGAGRTASAPGRADLSFRPLRIDAAGEHVGRSSGASRAQRAGCRQRAAAERVRHRADGGAPIAHTHACVRPR